MHFAITPNSRQPIYQQIVDSVRQAAADGRLKPGDKLPTVRALAEELLINPNTIARAYQELERCGVVYTKKGVGTFVADVRSAMSQAEKRRVLLEHIDRLLTEAVHLGFSRERLIKLLMARAKRFNLSEEDSS